MQIIKNKTNNPIQNISAKAIIANRSGSEATNQRPLTHVLIIVHILVSEFKCYKFNIVLQPKFSGCLVQEDFYVYNKSSGIGLVLC